MSGSAWVRLPHGHFMNKIKTCTKCGVSKPTSDYWNRKNICKQCLKSYFKKRYIKNRNEILEQHKKWYAKNKSQHVKKTNEWRRKNRFKHALISSRAIAKKSGHVPCTSNYIEIENAFTGKCEICGVSENKLKQRLHLDHDHKTGAFKGWLCGQCNVMLGMSGDSELILLRAISYIRKFKSC